MALRNEMEQKLYDREKREQPHSAIHWADPDCEMCKGFGGGYWATGQGNAEWEPCECWIKNTEIEKAQQRAEWNVEHGVFEACL